MLVEESRCYIKSEAVLRIALRLGMPLPLLAGLALLVPKFVGDPVYDQVGRRLQETIAGNACSKVLAGRTCSSGEHAGVLMQPAAHAVTSGAAALVSAA